MISSETVSPRHPTNQLVAAWMSRLAGSLERLTGSKPELECIGRCSGDEGPALWWEFVADASGHKIYAGAAEPAIRALAGRMLQANPNTTDRDPRQAYVNLLETASSTTGSLSGRVPPVDRFDVILVRFADQQTVRMLLGLYDAARDDEFDLGVLSSVEVPIKVRFGSTQMLLRDLIALEPGSAVEVSRKVDEPVDILVNDRLVARGDAVVVQGNYGIRVTEVVSRDARLSSSRTVVGGIQNEIK